MNDDQPTLNPLWQFARPVLGLAAWGAKQGHGSFLTFNFGKPLLEIQEPRKRFAGLKRSTLLRGQWHLWIYCCNWRVLCDGDQLAWSEDDRDQIGRAIYQIDGQKLYSTEVCEDRGYSNFRFDLGGEIQTWPYDGDQTSEQWMWFSGEKVFTYWADGRYQLSRSDVADDAEGWLPLN